MRVSPDEASHIRAVWSADTESKYRPSKEGETPLTQSAWPRRVLTQYPVVTSHILRFLSLDAEMSKLPDKGRARGAGGDEADGAHGMVVPGEGPHAFVFVGRVPEFDGEVLATGCE